MAVFSVPNVAVKGLACCVPANKVSNLEAEVLPEKERELFVKTTGIEHRRIAPKGMTTTQLCQKAAEEILTSLGWGRGEIDALVLVTQTPDHSIPGSASALQHKLGLPKSCLAFDINLGCSGYVYGLSTLSSIMSNIKGSKGLLLVGDISTATISPNDKSVAPLFSDAASATALAWSEGENMSFNLTTDGSGYEAIIVPDGGMKSPLTEDSLKEQEIQPGISRRPTDMILNGIDVFNFSVGQVPPSVKELLKANDKTVDDIDYFAFHQANKLMNESIRKKLGIAEEKYAYSLEEYGNTSSATIPVTLVHALHEQLGNEKLSLLLSGFGVGLSVGSVMLTTNHIPCLPMIEL